jgi:hypothetical protein
MSDIEKAAKPLLIPMILGQPIDLTTEDQTVVSRWIAKTAMVYQRTTKHHAIRPHQYRYLALNLRPPPSSQVWLAGRTNEDPRPSYFGIRAAPMGPLSEIGVTSEERFYGFFVTLTIGLFIGQFFGHDLPFDSPWIRRGVFAAAVEQIWPVIGPIKWPPPNLIRSNLDDFSQDAGFYDYFIKALAARGIKLELLRSF